MNKNGTTYGGDYSPGETQFPSAGIPKASRKRWAPPSLGVWTLSNFGAAEKNKINQRFDSGLDG